MKVYLTENFRRQVKGLPEEKHRSLAVRLDGLARSVENTDEQFRMLARWRMRKWQKESKIWKIDLNSGERIFLVYTGDIPGFNPLAESGILIVEYRRHDEQYQQLNLAPSFYGNCQYEEHFPPVWRDDQDEVERLEHEYLARWSETQLYYKNHLLFSQIFQEGLKLANVVFSLEQDQAVRHGLPLILSGAAGSGKTLVGLHVLNKYARVVGENGLYLTYSEGLRRESLKRYRSIDASSRIPDFYALHRFCLQQLGLPESVFMGLERFCYWYSHFLGSEERSQFDGLQVWTEIRGLIKGYMGDEWRRNLNRSLLGQEHYLEGLHHSVYSRPERQKLYGIARQYQLYLERNHLLDDNDLARMLLLKLQHQRYYSGIDKKTKKLLTS